MKDGTGGGNTGTLIIIAAVFKNPLPPPDGGRYGNFSFKWILSIGNLSLSLVSRAIGNISVSFRLSDILIYVISNTCASLSVLSVFHASSPIS